MRDRLMSTAQHDDTEAQLEMRELCENEINEVSGAGIIGAIVGGAVGAYGGWKAIPASGGTLIRTGGALWGGLSGAVTGGCLSPV